jgi:CRP-like cAMP-binding protein
MEVCRVLGFLETPAHGLVFEQGSRGDTFYIVLVGSVSVTVYDPVRDLHTKIADLKFGDSFGELALMTDGMMMTLFVTTVLPLKFVC